jgi:hypothetical protein
MRNPLKNEEAAFRFLLGTIVYFALIVLAAWIATWLGLVVFAALTIGVIVFLWGTKGRQPPPDEPGRAEVDDTPADGQAPPGE